MKKRFIFLWLRRSRCENGCGVVKSCSVENPRSWKQGSLSCRLVSCVLFREKPILKAVENLCGVAEAQACGIRSTAIRRWQDSNFGLIVCRNTWFLHMKKRHAAHRIRICSNRRYFKRRKQKWLYCTRKSDIPVTRSGFCLLLSAETLILPHMKKWHTLHRIRMHSNSRDRRVSFLLENLDGIAPEKATYPAQDPDFACC